jgi:Tfp pilus assembly protein PilF
VPELWRAGERRILALAACAAAAAFSLASLPLLDPVPYRVGALTNMGSVRYQQGRDEEADAYYQQALAANPESADLQFHIAALRMRQGRLTDAELHLRQMLEVDDGDFRGHSLLVSVLRQLGRPEEAAVHRRRAAQLNPEPGRRSRFHGRSGQDRLDALRERARGEAAPQADP